MQNYEITCIIPPDLPETDQQKILEKASSLIQTEGGIVVEMKASAQKIPFFTSKRQEAVSFTLEFQADPACLQNLDKKLKDEKQIIRYFTMAKPKARKMARQRKKEIKKPLAAPSETQGQEPKVKVEIAEIEKKLEEILNQ